MLTLDGSQGEGGGQILRSALALSAVTGTPFRLDNIRAGRPRPGLRRQHLTAVRAAAAVCNARVEGAALDSRQLSFRPGAAGPGYYDFDVGTAGSATLVFQTVLPPLMLAGQAAGKPSRLGFSGGTHNPGGPPFDFIDRAFLRILRAMGQPLSPVLERAGFYPAGGGRFAVVLEPAGLKPVHLPGAGAVRRRSAAALVAGLPPNIADRELAVVRRRLGFAGHETQVRELPAAWGPGNCLLIEVECETTTELFTGFGERGRPAEAVASAAADEARLWIDAGVAAGEHLADQLLLPFALAGGGSFTTLPLTPHSRTNIDVIRRFLDVEIDASESADGTTRVEVRRK